MEYIKVPKSLLIEHPLYQWEWGMHRPWYLRGRIPPVAALPLVAGLVVADIALMQSSVGITDATLYFPLIYLVAYFTLIVRRWSVGLRMMELRTSGMFRELFLSSWNPVETHAAFLYGNRPRPWEYLLLAMGVSTVVILIPALAVWLAFLPPFLVIGCYFSPFGRRAEYAIWPARDAWMLEAKGLGTLLMGGMSDQLWLLIMGIAPFVNLWVTLVLFGGGITLWVHQFWVSQWGRAMNVRQTRNYLGKVHRGEETVELRGADRKPADNWNW